MGERMKTLYEILEVSETASNEVIEKAYKVLAKKYHPDLWPQDKKEYAENKMQEINNAYDVLSDEAKRKEYDYNLNLEKQKELEKKIKEQNKNSYNQNVNYNNYNKQNEQTQEDFKQEEIRKMQEEMARRQEELRMRDAMNRNMQAKYEQKYQQAYENYLRNLGYKIKYKWTWKNYKDLIITILILAIICTVLWFFPITHKWIIDFYESNPIIKTIIDIIGNIFVGIWNGICSIFNFK